MGDYVSDLYQALIDQLLAQPEAEQEPYYSTAESLRAFADAIWNDAGDANAHIQRLLSSGRGEAMDALAGHWNKIMHQDVRSVSDAAAITSQAATAIADTLATAKAEVVQVAATCAVTTTAELVGGALVFGAADDVVATNIAVAQTSARTVTTRCGQQIVGVLSRLQRDPAVAGLDGVATDLAGAVGDRGAGAGAGTGRARGSLVPDAARDAGQGVKVDHAEHERAAGRLREVSTQLLGTTGGALRTATAAHATAAAGGSLAASVAPTLDTVLDNLSKATTAFGDHLGGTLPDLILRMSEDQQATDDTNRKHLAQLD
ncbi:hypothetical protein ACH4M4_09025 [Streptomyces sp. NPDC017254]|uniref:hypothetical protein n=1 Tax=unclassified Streptomyces TaxID=2593676 RepID=UPI00378C6F90